VEQTEPLDPQTFIELVTPAIEQKDLSGLLNLLRSRWTSDQIVGLLSSENTDAAKMAALSLALVGCVHCIPDIAKQLRHSDYMVNQMAEHALWSIWFRAGSPQAVAQLSKGTEQLNRRNFHCAVGHFTRAIELDRTFAEAYNQRAIAHYLQECFEQSIADCRKTVELMPCHFGAWAGLGHSFAHLGKLRQAVEAYQQALAVNPHLECVAESIAELQKRLHK
jgi:tetratricopeptide (TPR) repeat protein